MRFRLIIGVVVLIVVTNAHAQWTIETNPSLPGYVAGNTGFGGPSHSTARVRITEVPGVVTNGPFYLTFGPAGAMYWGFRSDASYNLHLDRQGYSGWAEGFVFNRDGNFGIGTDNPAEILHATRDQNAGTILRVSNASNGASAYTSLRFTEGSTLKAEIKSVSSGVTPAEEANALHITNAANGAMFFKTNNQERMHIGANGNVGINFAGNHSARLMVQHGVANSNALFVTHQPTVGSNANQIDGGVWVQVDQNVAPGVLNTGNVFGSSSRVQMTGTGILSELNGTVIETGTTLAGTITESYGLKVRSTRAAGSTIGTGYGVHISDVLANNDYAFYQEGTDDTNVFRGNVVIGPPIVAPAFVPSASNALNVNGNAHFNGTVTGTNIKAHYQDVAEWVPSTTDLAPGTVVILNRERDNEVMASATAYDTTVAGVVSAQPGLSLGVEGEGKEQVATTGRVKVRVDARSKPIRVGDLLVTSDMPGTAMRSEPMDLNGRPFHQPGTIIGKALQALDGGVGEILVLLSMQ